MERIILILLIVLIVGVAWIAIIQFITSFLKIDTSIIFKNIFMRKKADKDEYDKLVAFVNKLASALIKMSLDKVGALIVVEKKENLNQYINIGNRIESDFLPELVYTIFYNKKSPLHDGAIIIRDWKIVSVSSYLPTSKKIINVQYGARHRAAFGITEKFDCYAFVVSETNGNITGVHLDETKHLSNIPEKLTTQLIQMFLTSNMISARNQKMLKEQKQEIKNKTKKNK